MARKKALWKELGFKEVKSPSGGRKGFIDKEGNYLSERQFRKEIAATPMKGSQGYKERQAAKAAGRDFRPATKESIFRELKAAAKNPGMTLEQFTTGKKKELSTFEKRITSRRNAFMDEQRRAAIEFKKLAGVLTDKQAEQAEKDLKNQAKAREKAQELREKLKNPMTRDKRIKLEEQYRKQADKINKLQKKLEKKGVVQTEVGPNGESLRYGYYH